MKSPRTAIAAPGLSTAWIRLSLACLREHDRGGRPGFESWGGQHSRAPSSLLLAADLQVAERLKEIVGDLKARCFFTNRSQSTTLRVGGPAQFWVEPPQRSGAFAELFDPLLPSRKSSAFQFIGRGSNLLVRDGGIPLT